VDATSGIALVHTTSALVVLIRVHWSYASSSFTRRPHSPLLGAFALSYQRPESKTTVGEVVGGACCLESISENNAEKKTYKLPARAGEQFSGVHFLLSFCFFCWHLPTSSWTGTCKVSQFVSLVLHDILDVRRYRFCQRQKVKIQMICSLVQQRYLVRRFETKHIHIYIYKDVCIFV